MARTDASRAVARSLIFLAALYTSLLRERSTAGRIVSPDAILNELSAEIQEGVAPLVVLSALPPAAVSHARAICKRLRSRFPELELVVGL